MGGEEGHGWLMWCALGSVDDRRRSVVGEGGRADAQCGF